MPLLKPKTFQDITHSQKDVFRSRPVRLNLGYAKSFCIPVTSFIKSLFIIGAIGFFIFGSVAAPTTHTLAKSNDTEREALEAQLQDLEKQINQYEGQVTTYKKQGKSLKGEIALLNGKIAKLSLQIKAITFTLGQLDIKIGETQEQIHVTESSITSNKDALGGLVNNLYKKDQTSLFEIFLNNPRLSDFFSDVNNTVVLQGSLRLTIARIVDLQDQLKDHKAQLAVARADAATVKAYQDAQKVETDQVRKEKNQLLAVTKGEESRYQVLLKQTKDTAAQTRNRIFELLGGGQLTFEQAYSYARIASAATRVRPALILAVLDRESALGKNVGRCSYKTAMSPKNQEVFLQMAQELKFNPDTVFVSCANADGVYGGAMGPAQFIPTTWQLYKDQIASITKHNPASPFNNADAFVATALYLRDAGAANASVSQERTAAAKYYAGGNWKRYLWTYGEAVVSRAQRFEQDIATITG